MWGWNSQKISIMVKDESVLLIESDFDVLQCIIDALEYERAGLVFKREEILWKIKVDGYLDLHIGDKRFLQIYEYYLADLDADIAKYTAMQYSVAC